MADYNSILVSTKKLLGIDSENYDFDHDIITHINSVLVIASQMGVGANLVVVTGESETWASLGLQPNVLALMKSYIQAKVRLAFDPPTSSSVSEATNNLVKELEFRLYSATDFS